VHITWWLQRDVADASWVGVGWVMWLFWVNESVSVNHTLGLVRLRVLSVSIQAIC